MDEKRNDKVLEIKNLHIRYDTDDAVVYGSAGVRF